MYVFWLHCLCLSLLKFSLHKKIDIRYCEDHKVLKMTWIWKISTDIHMYALFVFVAITVLSCFANIPNEDPRPHVVKMAKMEQLYVADLDEEMTVYKHVHSFLYSYRSCYYSLSLPKALQNQGLLPSFLHQQQLDCLAVHRKIKQQQQRYTLIFQVAECKAVLLGKANSTERNFLISKPTSHQ